MLAVRLFLAALPFIVAVYGSDIITVCLPEFDQEMDASTCTQAEINSDQKVGTYTSCYWLEGQESLTYDAGMTACATKKGHLAHVYSGDVGALMSSQLLTGGQTPWLGTKMNGGKYNHMGAETTEESNMVLPAATGTGDCLVKTGTTLTPAECSATKPVLCQKDVPRAKFRMLAKNKFDTDKIKKLGNPTTEMGAWECGLRCTQKVSCVGYSYTALSKQCQLVAEKFVDFPENYMDGVEEGTQTFNRIM